MSLCWQDGYAAYGHGELREDNPYTTEYLRNKWFAGWDEAFSFWNEDDSEGFDDQD